MPNTRRSREYQTMSSYTEPVKSGKERRTHDHPVLVQFLAIWSQSEQKQQKHKSNQQQNSLDAKAEVINCACKTCGGEKGNLIPHPFVSMNMIAVLLSQQHSHVVSLSVSPFFCCMSRGGDDRPDRKAAVNDRRHLQSSGWGHRQESRQ